MIICISSTLLNKPKMNDSKQIRPKCKLALTLTLWFFFFYIHTVNVSCNFFSIQFCSSFITKLLGNVTHNPSSRSHGETFFVYFPLVDIYHSPIPYQQIYHVLSNPPIILRINADQWNVNNNLTSFVNALL